MKTLQLGVLLLILSLDQLAVASNKPHSWSSFRNGGQSTVAGRLPSKWSPEGNITWQVETDGYGQSAPLIIGNSIITTSVIGPLKSECAVSAFDLNGGRQLWQHKLATATEGSSNYMYSRAAPTPVADERAVYAFFESGDLVAVGMDGKELWHRSLTNDICEFQSNHGLGSSLAQSDRLIFLNIEHKGPSYLLAINKSDGTTAWKVDRPSGSSWTSPVFAADTNQVILSSAGSISGYGLANGENQWVIDGLQGNSVPSPCVVGNRVFIGARIPEFGSASEAAKSNLCVEFEQKNKPTVSVAWRAEGAVCDYASPIVDDEQVYFLNKVGVLSCLNTVTGKLIYRQRLRTECWATPIVADNAIYFFAKNGTTKRIARGPKFEVLGTHQLWDLSNPPAPEVYVEHNNRASGHGQSQAGVKKGTDESEGPATDQSAVKDERPRPGGMIGALLKNDRNGDGFLQKAELPPEFQSMLARVDKNGDDAIDKVELDAMAKGFAERRKGSKESSRDPIVYGVAAVPDSLVIRTGTRLFCIQSKPEARRSKEGFDQ